MVYFNMVPIGINEYIYIPVDRIMNMQIYKFLRIAYSQDFREITFESV